MKLCVMPSNLDGSGFYRVLLPTRELAARGSSVVMAPHRKEMRGGRLLTVYEARTACGRAVPVGEALRRLDFDVLVMQQRDEPHTGEFVRELRGRGKAVVVDSDDAWLDLPAYNPGSRKTRPQVNAMLDQLRAADGMTVATPALAEDYSPYNENVRVVRNTLDWRMWEHAPQQSEVERRRVRVGWMGDSFWRAGDLKVLQGVIGPWLERNPHVEFVAAGDPRVHDILGVPKAQRVSTNHTEFWHGDLADITACFDIGLIPLASNRMNECKSHLKGLEYAACGIPCIASPTESYRWWVTEGANGYLAAKPKQWTDALDVLVNDPALRRQMGWWSRAKAAQHTIQNHWQEWGDAYAEVCGTHPHPARTQVAA